jgi:hypothetical protein
MAILADVKDRPSWSGAINRPWQLSAVAP